MTNITSLKGIKVLDKAIKLKHYKGRHILLEQQKAAYLEIPKVACTSINFALAGHLGLLEGFDPKADIHSIHGNFPQASDLNQLFLGDYADYTKFSFVRNPWDRLVSCYINKIRSDARNNQWFVDGVALGFLQYNLFHAKMSFEEFAEAVLEIGVENANVHFLPQHYFLLDPKGNFAADFVGKFEHLQSSFDDLCDLIGLKKFELPHKNFSKKTKDTHYSKFYTTKLRDKIAAYYENDIELFNYEFNQ